MGEGSGGGLRAETCPGQVAPLVGALSHALKGCGFDSWLGPVPRLQVRSLVGSVGEATHQCVSLTSVFLSLSLHLPISLKSINISLGEDYKK